MNYNTQFITFLNTGSILSLVDLRFRVAQAWQTSVRLQVVSKLARTTEEPLLKFAHALTTLTDNSSPINATIYSSKIRVYSALDQFSPQKGASRLVISLL